MAKRLKIDEPRIDSAPVTTEPVKADAVDCWIADELEIHEGGSH